MIVKYIMLFLLFILCIYATISDIKFSIIRNKFLLFFAINGIILDIIYYVHYPYFISIFLFNITLMVVSSVILYFTHIWAAGDSKLLIVIGLFIPSNFTIYDEYLYYEIMIPVYSFAISFIYLIIDTLYLYLIKKKRISITDIYKQFKQSIALLIINSIYILTILKIEELVKITFNVSFGIFQWIFNILLLILISGQKFFYNKYCVFVVTLSSIIFSFISDIWMVNLNRVIYYIIIVFFIFIKIIINKYNYEEIDINDLKSGMILSTVSTFLFCSSKVKGLPDISTEDLKSRLNNDEIDAIKKWSNSKFGRKKLQIVRKIPFAIFISLGVLIYLFVGVYLRCS